MCDHLLQQRQLRISDAYNQSIDGQRLVGCCSTRAQVRHAAPIVFSVDFDGGKHVYRWILTAANTSTEFIPMFNW